MSSTDLYRFFDAAGDLLYVGISVSAIQRASEHRADKGWWHEVASMTVEKVPGDRSAALEAERLAILNEGPRYNVVHNRNGAPEPSRPDSSPDPLTGKWVHTFEGETLKWQGQIMARVGALYLVDFFDFVIGQTWGSRLYSLHEMTSWVIYDSEDMMCDAYEQYHRIREYKERDELMSQLGSAPKGDPTSWTRSAVDSWLALLDLCRFRDFLPEAAAANMRRVVLMEFEAASEPEQWGPIYTVDEADRVFFVSGGQWVHDPDADASVLGGAA